MNFHSTTAPRIREIDSTCTVEHRTTLHYGNSSSLAGIDDVMVVVKSVEEVKACPNSIETFSYFYF